MACSPDFVQCIIDHCSGADAITPNIVCSQDLRAFFEKYLGKGFRFKVEFQNWLRENAGLTFRDAVEAYLSLHLGLTHDTDDQRDDIDDNAVGGGNQG